MTPTLSKALWYAGRGSGLVALVLLTVVVTLGILTRARRPLPGLPRYAVAAVHRNTGLLAVSFLAVHITTLTLDPAAQIRLVDLVAPFHAGYRPAWMGLGTLAVDCLLAIVVTSLLRARLGTRAWRAVHWLAYAAWPAAFLHGLGSGSDFGRVWARGIAAGCFLAIAAAVAWRSSDGFAAPPKRIPRPRPPVDRVTGLIPSARTGESGPDAG
jgi:methionine sulfoxide reductase heme-binding subunit